MDQVFRPGDLLQRSFRLTRSREGIETPVPFAIPAWVSSRFFL